MRISSENGSFCENDGFSVINPVLGLNSALCADKIGFFCGTGLWRHAIHIITMTYPLFLRHRGHGNFPYLKF